MSWGSLYQALAMAHNHGDHDASNLKALVKQAQSAEGRPERDAERDRNRAGEDARFLALSQI